MAFPHGAVGWSAVCDCGFSLSNSLTFWCNLADELILHNYKLRFVTGKRLKKNLTAVTIPCIIRLSSSSAATSFDVKLRLLTY